MNQPIKSASNEYKVSPFYCIETSGTTKRYIASLQDEQRIFDFILKFFRICETEIELTIKNLSNPDSPIEYTGKKSVSDAFKAFTRYSGLLLHDGYQELVIKNPATGDYLVYDDHGLLFIYSDDDYESMFIRLALEHRPDQKMIYDFPHWHIGISDGATQLKGLIDLLQLTTTA